MADLIFASICLSDIPRDQIKEVTLKDGVTKKKYLNIKIVPRKEIGQYGHTHFISCEPKQEERRDGVNYIIGDGKVYVPQNVGPTTEEIAAAPAAKDDNDLPF